MTRVLTRLVMVLAVLALPGLALAQEVYGPPAPGPGEMVGMAQNAANATGGLNPVSVIEGAADAVPGFEGGLSGALNVIILLTVITLVPSVMLMCTCFVRFIVVLGLLTRAMGTQSLPPSSVITALCLFMTLFAMGPTIDRIYNEAFVPYQNGEITNQIDMWNAAKQPVRDFMFAQIEATDNWSAVFMLLNYRGVDTSNPQELTRADVDMTVLIPAYMLSELKTAFLMGFKVYLPFLVIDMVLASLLISMSMMMLPPVLISLPFKILLFVLVDGWQLIVGSLLTSVAPVTAGVG
jgi:flagellar biosynthetic protein FliP